MTVGLGGIFISSLLVVTEDVFGWGLLASWLLMAGLTAFLLIKVLPTQPFTCRHITEPSYRGAALIIILVGAALTIVRIVRGGMFIGVPWMSNSFDSALNQVMYAIVPAFCFAIAVVFTRLVTSQKRWTIGALLIIFVSFLTLPFGKRFYLIFFSAVVILSLIISHDKKSTIKPLVILLICGIVIGPINNWVRNVAYFSYAKSVESDRDIKCKNDDFIYPIFNCSVAGEYSQKWDVVVPTFFDRLRYSRDTIQFIAAENEFFSFDSENLRPSVKIMSFGFKLFDDVDFLVHEKKLNKALGRRAGMDASPTLISDAVDIFGYVGGAIFYGAFLAFLGSLVLPFLRNFRLTTFLLFGSYFYIFAWPEDLIGVVASNLRLVFFCLIADFLLNNYQHIFFRFIKMFRTDILIFLNHYLILWVYKLCARRHFFSKPKHCFSPVPISAKSLIVIYIHREDSWEFGSLPECLRSFGRVEVVLHDQDGFEGLISVGEKYRSDYETILITCSGIRQGLNKEGLLKIKRTFSKFIYFNLDDKRSFLFFDHGEITGPAVISRYADFVLTSERESVEKYKLFGSEARWFPEGANINVFKPIENSHKWFDVVFVGAAYGWRKELVEYLRDSCPDLSINCWGSGWESGRISTESINEKFNSAKIVLGHGGIGWSKTATQLKGRDFEVLVCGAIYLTSFNEDLLSLVEGDSFVFTYRSFDECVRLVREILNSELVVPAINVENRRLQHSWVRRFEQVFTRV